MEPVLTRRRVVLFIAVFVLPTLVSGLLGGPFWAAAIGLFAAVGLALIWLAGDDSEDLERGEYATDRNKHRRSMRFPFTR